MKRKKIYFTSDWHLFHENVLRFDNRPFKDLEHMHKVLINNYNSTVTENDVCYFLGDVGLCKPSTMRPIIEQLKGTKILILGNHDGGVNAMYECGFDLVINAATIYIANERVTLSHCPLRGIPRENTEGMRGRKEGENWHGESRHQHYSINNEGQFHLHGHIHSPNSGKSKKILDKQYDIGVVANKYRPVSVSQIESWISLYKQQNSG
ncbi:MAG TPA: hypothetical protein VIL57_00910 [Bacteroidia bacterium]